jgi:hypothetical protein
LKILKKSQKTAINLHKTHKKTLIHLLKFSRPAKPTEDIVEADWNIKGSVTIHTKTIQKAHKMSPNCPFFEILYGRL